MDLPALQAFVKVVQTGSFTRAAETLGTQKAHLSRVVSQLERSLGVRLLERTTRALSLTEAGREFFERAQGILAAVDDAERAMQDAQAAPRGTLKLTCGVEFGMMAVSHWVGRYLQRFPEMKVEADFTARVVDLVHEGFDLAVRLGPLADSTLAARKLGELGYGLYASPDYLARCGRPDQPAAVAGHALLAFAGAVTGPAAPAHWRLSQGTRQERVALRPRLKANNVFAIRDAAQAGLGIAALPCIVASPLLREGALQPVLPDWSLPGVPVHAVFASARYLTPKVRSFIDLAVELMA
jgi:LysR family transcriptional regulator, regulator for bpeEF and oprC